MRIRMKRILAYILMITLLMGNTMSASASSVGSITYEEETTQTDSSMETVMEESSEEEADEEFGEASGSEERMETEESSADEGSVEESNPDAEETSPEASSEDTEAESATEESATEESSREENTTEQTEEESVTEQETTTEEITSVEETTEEPTTEEMLSAEAFLAGVQGEKEVNVSLYFSQKKDGEYTKAGAFVTLQDALNAIEELNVSERFYRIELENAEAETVTFSAKALTMPKKTAGLTIAAAEELTEPFVYLKGALKLQSDVTFEDIVFVPSGKVTAALGNYSLTLSNCRVDEDGGGAFSSLSGSGVKGTSKLVLKETDLHISEVVNSVGTVVFAGEDTAQAGAVNSVKAVSSLTVDGKINIGNIELETDGYLMGAASVTRSGGKITKITPQITINGEAYSENESTLYLDLSEKVSGTFEKLGLDKEEAADILKSGVSFAKAQVVTYPHIKAAQRNESEELVKSAGYLKYFEDGYGVVLSFVEDGEEQQIPCYTFADAVTEINNRKTKLDYTITLTEDCAVTSGARQDIQKVAPKALTMPNKNYVESLVMQADPEAKQSIVLGFTGNITFTSTTTLRDVKLVQMVKSGSKYVTADVAKDGFAAAVTLKTGGFDLTIDKTVTFNTPLILNGGNKGDLIINKESVIHTLTNDWEPGENSSGVVIFGSITGVDEMVVSGQDVTLNEYRAARTGKKYTASANKITTLSIADSVFAVNGTNKAGSLTVKNLSVDNGEVLVGGKAVLTNVTLEGRQKALVSADLDFTISGTLTSKSNNATLLTRLKGAGKAPYLTVNGKVVREEGILPVYVGVYPQNTASETVRNQPVELSNAPKVTAQLLTAKNALAVDFRPVAENYPWGSGEYNKDNTSGYMMMKTGKNIYVYDGSKVKVAVYVKETADTRNGDGELFGFFSSIKEATSAVNRQKNKNAYYTYVLMEVNGTAASPVTLTLPSYASQVTVKGLEDRGDAVKTITFSGNVTLGADTVLEDIILAPVKSGKSTTFTLAAKNKSLTLKNVDLPATVSKAGTLTVQGDSVVSGNVEAACLRLENDGDGNATVFSVAGTVKVTNLENYGENANVLEYTRTAKNVTKLTINGQITNEYADQLVILRQKNAAAVPVLSKTGIQVSLKDAYKLAVMPKVSTDSFVMDVAAVDAQREVVSSEYLLTVKANKGIYRIDNRDSGLTDQMVTLESISDSKTTVTSCLDYAQAVNEINNRADKTADYTVSFAADSAEQIRDLSLTDTKKFSAFTLPKKNTKASLILKPAGDERVTIPFTGNLTGFGNITLENVVLEPVKGASNAKPANVKITATADATGVFFKMHRVTTQEQLLNEQQSLGYISDIKGTANKSEVSLVDCGELLFTSGISGVKKMSLEDTNLLSVKTSTVTELTLDDDSAWISLGKLTLTNVNAPEGVINSYVGVKQDAKGNPQLTVNGSVSSGALLVRLFKADTAVSSGMELFDVSTEKEVDSYLNVPLVLAKKADAAGFRAYAYRIIDENGTIAENADGVHADNFASYKDGDYVKNGTQEAMFLALGSDELRELAEEAKTELEQLAQEKELYALIYLTDSYDVKEEAGHESATVASLASGHTVQVLGMDVEWSYSSDLEEYIPVIWYYVQFYIGDTLYTGYVEESYLAYSDELLLQWKNDWYMLFPLENTTYASYAAGTASYSDVQQFPLSYQASLETLKAAHPNWTFVPMNVGRNWSDCVDEQMGDYSWIYYNQPAEFRGAQINSTWYYASRAGVEYYMDPRNFLTESNIFQFEQNTYNASYHTQSALQSFLSSTFMSGKVPGDSQGRTYAYVIWNSGKTRGLSPFNLAARVIQEQGVNGTSAMISGTYAGYEGYYNYYNIQASGTTNEQVIRSGLAYAKSMGWNTRVKSLDGGAAFIGNGYILKGQDTLYLQKFDIEHGSDSLHQYMQNIMAPYSEGRSMKSMYSDAGSLNSSFVFKIPVFDNMPQEYSMTPTSVKLAKGKTQQLTVKCSGKKVSTDIITFTTSNSDVATVSSTGLITAVGTGNTEGKIGTATITAKVKGFDKELTCKVQVTSPLKDITLSIEEENLYLEEGLPDRVPVLVDGKTTYLDKEDCPTQTTLTVTYIPEDTTDSRKVTWTVENPEVADVIRDTANVGKATVVPKAGGKTKITAKVGDITSTVTVTVRVPMTEASLKLDEEEITLYKGQKTQVNIFYAPYETTDSIDPVWTSADEDVAKIVDGEIVAVGTGSATLYASVGPFVGSQSDVAGLSCKITVKEYTVTFMDTDRNVMLTATGDYGSSLENLSAQKEIPWQLEKEDYVFAGWYTEPDGEGFAVNEKIILHGDMTLYPYFIDAAEGFYAKPIGDTAYTGAYLKPTVEVYSGAELLTYGTDYTVVYLNNKVVNDQSDTSLQPAAVIYGKGLYSGKQYKSYFNIVPKDISHTDVTAGNLLNDYTGKEQQMEPVLYDGGRTLQKNIDYTLSYYENDAETGAYSEAGTYAVKVTGIGNYSGSRTVHISISKRTLLSRTAIAAIADMKFNNGKAYSSAEEITDCIPAAVKITYGGYMLQEGVDYTLQYENNRDIGTAKVIITGIGDYIGTRTKYFRITGTAMSNVTVKGISAVEYSGENAEQDVSKLRLTNKSGVLLRKGIDYELSYQSNTDAGRALMTITGINGYSGTLIKSFTVTPYDIAVNSQTYEIEGEGGAVVEKPAFEIAMDEEAVEYDKAGVSKAVEVTFKGKRLQEGTDYKLSYQNVQAPAQNGDTSPIVVITGIGNFKGTVSKTFTVTEKDLAKVTMTAKNVTFRNRKGFCFVEPVLMDESGRYLTAGTDYEKELTYTYEADTTLYNGETRQAGEDVLETDIPTAGSVIRVTATGKGNYTGSISCTFEIL